MANTNDYYTKAAIEARVFGSVTATGGRYGKHDYYRCEDFANEIIAAVDTGDRDFLLRVAHILTRRLQQQSYEKGIADTKADIRKKLGLDA